MYKTFKNRWTLEFNTGFKRPSGINIDLNWYAGTCHPGLYIHFNILWFYVDIEFYGPDKDLDKDKEECYNVHGKE